MSDQMTSREQLKRRNAFWLLGLLSAANIVQLLDESPLFEFGIFVYPMDLMAILFASLAMKNFVTSRRNLTVLDLCLWTILAYSLLRFFWGLTQFGSQAGVEFRQDFSVLSVMLFLASVRFRTEPEELFRLLGILAAGYLVLAFGRYTGLIEATVDAPIALGSNYQSYRTLPANGALVFALIGLLMLSLSVWTHAQDRARQNFLFAAAISVAMFVLVLFSYHRTVWIAVAVGLTAFQLAAIKSPLFRGKLPMLFILSVILFDLFIAYLLLADANILRSAVSEVFSDRSTFLWRIRGWEGLIEQMPVLNYLFGMSYGADSSRLVFGTIINNSAHNFYLGMFWTLGAVGLVLYAILYILIAYYVFRVTRLPPSNVGRMTAFVLLVIFLSIQVFYVSYSHWMFAAIVFGYSVSFLRNIASVEVRSTGHLQAGSSVGGLAGPVSKDRA